METPKNRVTSQSIIGAIHSCSVIYVFFEETTPKKKELEAEKKKKKVNSGKKRAVTQINKKEEESAVEDEGDTNFQKMTNLISKK